MFTHEATMDDEKRTHQAGTMRAVMTHLPLETWNELDAIAQLVSAAIPRRDQPVLTPHHAWYEDTLRAIGHELDRRAVSRVTIVELEQCLLVYGHQPTEGECGRFERVWTVEDLMALL